MIIDSSAYSAFLFDLDGTLADTMPAHNQSWLEVFAQDGIVVEPISFVRKATGMAGVDIIKEFAYPNATSEQIKEIAKRRIVIFKRLISKDLVLLEGAKDFLDNLKSQNKKMAIATSSSLGVIDFLVETLGLKEWFPIIITRKEVQHGKPFPDLFLKAAEELNTPAEQCLVFEDSFAGIEAASRANMDLCIIQTALNNDDISQIKNAKIIAKGTNFLTLKEI